MNKNYYEILQINQNASSEIIEKAYKTLAKKYHPDLQEESKKSESEEILKEINEAYEVLSDPIKRKNYDMTLTNSSITEEKLNQLYNENQVLKKKLYELQQKFQNTEYQNHLNTNNHQQSTQNNNARYHTQNNSDNSYYEEEMQQARNQAYYDAYIQDLKNRGYKIRYKKSLEERIRGIISIILTLFILFLIYQIPFVKNYLKNNIFIQTCSNIFKQIFS